MYKTIITLTAFILLAAQAVHADDKPADDLWLLAKYDSNGDSVISAGEIENKRQRVFAHMDENADGDVSFEEYKSLDSRKRDPILQAQFAKLDANNDGRLSGQEYSTYLGSFERMDQNGDGQVTKGEISPKAESVEEVKPEADLCLLWVCVRKNYK